RRRRRPRRLKPRPATTTVEGDQPGLRFASRMKIPMWTVSRSGTKKPGIKSQGKVVMRAELGSAKIKRAGPGEEITPNPTAAIKSASPTTFQLHRIGRAFAGRR